jgi:hypothetical protein
MFSLKAGSKPLVQVDRAPDLAALGGAEEDVVYHFPKLEIM